MKFDQLSNLPMETGARTPRYATAADSTLATSTVRDASVAQPARTNTQTATVKNFNFILDLLFD